jgi:uncharacterized protein
VLSSYFETDRQIGEWAGLALLPLFLSLRAAIRAMVGVHSLAVMSQDERSDAEQAIRDYLALAIDLLTQQPPLLVCIGGLSGTGKTTIARALAPTIGAVPGAIHLRSDIERKLMFGVEPLSPLPATAYSVEVSDKLYRCLFDEAAAILRTGHSVVLDAGFREPGQRDAAAKLAEQERVAFRALWLQADPRRLIARVAQRRNDASDASAEVVRRQLQTSALPPTDWDLIDANGSVEQTLAQARTALHH